MKRRMLVLVKRIHAKGGLSGRIQARAIAETKEDDGVTAGYDQGGDANPEKVGREIDDDGEKDKAHDRGTWKKPNYSIKRQH